MTTLTVAGQSRSLSETKHVVRDVQGCRVYRAGQAFEQGQHHDCNQDLQCTPLLHLPTSISEVGVSLSIRLNNDLLQISCCLTEPVPLQMGQCLGMTRPFTEDLDCYLTPMSFKAVLSVFTSELCTWAGSREAGFSVEQRKPEKIVVAVQQMLSSSYIAFTFAWTLPLQDKQNS